jgi:hypothetical protein
MGNESGSRSKIDMQALAAAIDSLKQKGWHVNPYSVAQESGIPRILILRTNEALALLATSNKGLGEKQAPASVSPAAEKNESDAARLEQLERENNNLKEQLTELGRLDEVEYDNEVLRRSVEELKQQVDSGREEIDKLKSVQADVEKAKHEAESSQEEIDKHKREAEASREEIDKHKREAEASREEIDTLKREAEASQEEIDKLKREAEASREEIDKHKREAEASREEIDKHKEEAALQKSETEKHQSDTEAIAELKEENARLKQEVKQLESIERLEEENKDLLEKVFELKQELQDTKENRPEFTAEELSELKSSAARVQELTDQVAELQAQNRELESLKTVAEENENLRQQIAFLEQPSESQPPDEALLKEIADLRQENQELSKNAQDAWQKGHVAGKAEAESGPKPAPETDSARSTTDDTSVVKISSPLTLPNLHDAGAEDTITVFKTDAQHVPSDDLIASYESQPDLQAEPAEPDSTTAASDHHSDGEVVVGSIPASLDPEALNDPFTAKLLEALRAESLAAEELEEGIVDTIEAATAADTSSETKEPAAKSNTGSKMIDAAAAAFSEAAATASDAVYSDISMQAAGEPAGAPAEFASKPDFGYEPASFDRIRLEAQEDTSPTAPAGAEGRDTFAGKPEGLENVQLDSRQRKKDSGADITPEDTGVFTAEELHSLFQNRYAEKEEGKEDKEGAPAVAPTVTKKFVGTNRSSTEPLPTVSRVIPPEVRKACRILGLNPEELNKQVINDAWKKAMASGIHPDTGGDTEIAIYLNTSKETLLRWLEDQAPKLGKKFGAGTREGKQPPNKKA